MKRIAAALLCGVLFFGVYGQVDTSKSKFWMMTYFRNDLDQTNGVYLAFSSDTTGIRWQKYRGDTVIMKPGTALGTTNNLCRDPMIAYAAVGDSFHLIWTVAWTGTIIGYASSKNLKTWSTPVGLPVGQNIANCSVCWAPEIYYDDLQIQNKWMIYWSTNQSGGDKHIYYVLTNNIRSLTTAPTPTLLFNPGYTVIDANIFKYATGSYYMFFKDERDGNDNKDIHYVTGSTPQGSWGTVHAKVANYGTEGPCLVKQGNEYHCFFDPYGTTVTYRMTRTTDINTTTTPWTDAGTLQYWVSGTTYASFRYSHANVIEIPKKYVLWMLYNIPLPTVGVKYMPTIMPKTELYGGNIRVFDLSGRMVAIERILSGYGTSSKLFIGHLPAGFYVKTAGNENRSVQKELVKQK